MSSIGVSVVGDPTISLTAAVLLPPPTAGVGCDPLGPIVREGVWRRFIQNLTNES